MVSCKFNSDEVITIGKSDWASWDLFEFSNKNTEHVQFINYKSYMDIYKNYSTLKIDGALSTIYEAILAASAGATVKIICLLDYTNGADILLAHSEIDSLIKLKDKRIGVEYGSISHFTAIKAIEMSGLSVEDVNFVYDSMHNLIEKFQYKQIDVIATFEPFSSQIFKNENAVKLFSSKSIPRKICDVFYVNLDKFNDETLLSKLSNNWFETSKKVLIDEDEITLKMNQFYLNNGKNYKFSLQGINVTSELENKIAFSERGYLYSALSEMMEFMFKYNIIDKKINVDDMIYKN